MRVLFLTPLEERVYDELIRNLVITEGKFRTSLRSGYTKDSRKHAVALFINSGLIESANRKNNGKTAQNTSGTFFFLVNPDDLLVCRIEERKKAFCSGKIIRAIRWLQAAKISLTVESELGRNDLVKEVAKQYHVSYQLLKRMVLEPKPDSVKNGLGYLGVLFQAEVGDETIWVLSWPGLEYYDLVQGQTISLPHQPTEVQQLIQGLRSLDFSSLKTSELAALNEILEDKRSLCACLLASPFEQAG